MTRHGAALDWSVPMLLTVALAIIASLYARGWLRLRASHTRFASIRQAVAFLSGILSVWVVLGAPLARFDHELLLVHMLQHIVLMGVAAPLMLVGEPAQPLRHGLPQSFVHGALASGIHGLLNPLRGWAPARRVGSVISQPVFCWFTGTVTVLGWHIPAVFALAMGSHFWHGIQQASFLVAGLFFWWPVLRSSASGSGYRGWSVPLYLFGATLPCDALSAFLVFCDRVVYRTHVSMPHAAGLSPIQDQEWAGVVMWVFVTFIYGFPAVVITVRLLSPRKTQGIGATAGEVTSASRV